MKIIGYHDWVDRIAPMQLPDWYSEPLKITYDAWKDPTDPLGSMLEVFKWARIAGYHGIFPSVFAGQVFHESDLGLKQDAILGIKATAKDMKEGTYKRLRTREVVKPSQEDGMKRCGEFIERVKVLPDGMVEVKCWQNFHFQEGLSDDFEKLLSIYEMYHTKYNKPRVQRGWTPRDFLEKVTQADPAYATGEGYADSVMGHINRFKLAQLDAGFPV